MPGYAAELAARRAALAAFRARPAGAASSNYFGLLARIDEAGLLDEYVWNYLRDARVDLNPPAGLDLAAFEEFRQRELGSHVVQSGARVRINEARPLAAGNAP